ncbi:hypothetical protein MPSEU_000854100 [Mayamaea pseudoterrestris]|nr:hypothetical protein MPSEU_000854100 [Mayamaea pseudoterrestris]
MSLENEGIRQSWNDHFRSLVSFKKQHGHCLVPFRYMKNTALGCWVAKQRSQALAIAPERRKRLDQLGFCWETNTERFERLWLVHFRRLKAYRLAHGDFKVAKSHDPVLAKWVAKQRSLYNKQQLLPHRCAHLKAIKFDWGRTLLYGRDNSDRDANWMRYYARLEKFQRVHKHTLVPITYKENNKKSLGTWVSRQRLAFSKGELTADRKELLDDIGFVYRVNQSAACIRSKGRKWDRRYMELIRYVECHGHVPVPSDQYDLCRWLNTQKILSQEKRLHPCRESKLANVIGLNWAASMDASTLTHKVSLGKNSSRSRVGKSNDVASPFKAQTSDATKRQRDLMCEGLDGKITKRRTPNVLFQMVHPFGTRVRKHFPDYGWFFGHVIGFDAELGYYSVRYEDEDKEEYNRQELEEILVGNGCMFDVELSKRTKRGAAEGSSNAIYDLVSDDDEEFEWDGSLE